MDQQVTSAKGKRFRRSTKLIADFSDNGYTKNWTFAVHECFRAALDIKYIPRVQIQKLAGGSKRKITIYVWTQGRTYDFRTGDLIHSKSHGLSVQVLNASPAAPNFDMPDSWSHGFVSFQIIGGTSTKSLEYGSCTQTEFVQFLRKGDRSWQRN